MDGGTSQSNGKTMQTPEEVADDVALIITLGGIRDFIGEGVEPTAEAVERAAMLRAIELDRAQRPNSAELKKAYDYWSEVFEGDGYFSDEQERAAQLELAETLREFMEQLEPGAWK